MGRVKIVTDSTAYLEVSVVKRLGITVVPLTVRLGDETFQEGLDINAEEFFQKLDRSPPCLWPFRRRWRTSRPSILN